MNRQLLIAVLMLFSGSIATAHAETLSRQYDQAVATSTEALEQAADTTKEWAGKTSEKLQLQQKYDSVKSSVDTTIGNVQNTWNAPENKAARAEAENQLKSSWDGMMLQGKKVWQSVTNQPAQPAQSENGSTNAASPAPASNAHPAQQLDASGNYPDPAQ